MKRRATALALAAAALIACPAAAAERASAVDYPYVAALSRVSDGQRVYFCTGTLIAARWIVSAAHCFHSRSGERISAQDLWAVVGRDRLNLAEPAAQVRVAAIVVHPRYDHATQRDDIALVRLADEAGPLVAEVARGGVERPRGATALGFGSFYEGALAARALSASGAPVAQLSGDLQRAGMSLIEPAGCEARLGRGGGLCATAGPDDACTGDSGGPLVDESGGAATLIGIVSLGTGCREPGPVVLYTDVASYRDWIAATLVPR